MMQAFRIAQVTGRAETKPASIVTLPTGDGERAPPAIARFLGSAGRERGRIDIPDRSARVRPLPAVVRLAKNSGSAGCAPRRSLEHVPPVPLDEFALGSVLRGSGHLDFSAVVPKEPLARFGRGGRQR